MSSRNSRPPPEFARNVLPLQKTAPVFAALGDETRLRLIAVLCAGSAMSIAQLTSGTDISRQAVTKHLQVLADGGLVHHVKLGRERLWEFKAERLDEARRSLDEIARQWDHALNRLKAVLEACWRWMFPLRGKLNSPSPSVQSGASCLQFAFTGQALLTSTEPGSKE